MPVLLQNGAVQCITIKNNSKMELKAGMWIAQGSQTNVLLRLGGKAAMLYIK